MKYGKHHAGFGHCDYSSAMCRYPKKTGSGICCHFGIGDRTFTCDTVLSCVEKHKRIDDVAFENCEFGTGAIESGNQNGWNFNCDKIVGGDMQRRQRGRNCFVSGVRRFRAGSCCVCTFDRSCFIPSCRAFVKQICLLSVLLIVLSGRAAAMSQEEVLDAQIQALNLEVLKDTAREYAPKFNWGEVPDLNKGLSSLLEKGREAFGGVLGDGIRSCVILLAIVLFSGVADSIWDAKENSFAIPMAASLAIASVSVADATSLIGLGREMIGEVEAFTKVLVPTMAAVIAASGAPASAASHQLATMLFSDVLVSIINRLLLPIVYAYIAAHTAYAALGNEGLKRIASTLKWVVTSVLTLLLIAFVGYLSISGVIAGTSDAMTLKTAKFAVSSMVPVVGGILSDAAETILAGAGILKNTVGVFGMLVVLGMSVVPFLQLGVHYLTYKLTATLTAMFSGSRTSGLIDGIGSAFGLVLGMCGSCVLIMLISLISAIKVAGL